MANLAQSIARFLLTRFVPRKNRVNLSPIRGMPPQASQVDADELHAILGEAAQGYTRRLFALYRDIIAGDSHILGALTTRKMAVLNKPMQVQPVDAKNAADVATAEACKAMLDRIPNLTYRLAELLDSALYPVSVMEKSWKPADVPGLRYDLATLKHQDAQLLDYRDHVMKLEAVDPHTRQPCGRFEVVDTWDFIVHRGHLMTAADNFGGPMRALLFWWLFSTQNRDWWVRFLDRFGAPFMVGRYPTGDEESRWTLESAFSAASRLFGIAVTDDTKVEVHEVSATHGDAFEKFWNTAQKEKSKLILGQTLSTEAGAQGLGNGSSDLQGEVRKDIEAFDGLLLCTTLRDQLLRQFIEINGLPGRPPIIFFGAEDAGDAKEFAETLKTAGDAGFEPTDEAVALVSQRLGFEVRRKASPQPPALPGPGVKPATFDATTELLKAGDAIAANAAADLSQAFRGHLAPIAQLLRESESAADFERRVKLFYADSKPGRIAQLIQEGLTAYAANGAGAKTGP